MSDIPGINYTIRQSLDRLKYQASVYNEEFVQRLLLVMGHPDWYVNTAYGIVSEANPESAVAGSTGVPLTVSINNTNSETVDISPGMAVTKSSMLIFLPDYARQIELADPSVGITNVVYLRYVLDPADSQINDYFDAVTPVTYRPGSVNSVLGTDVQIDCDTLEIYMGYDENVRADYVPLAVVTMQSSQDPLTSAVTNQLSIDHTRGNYSWNRPWFSAVDVAHRNQLGTGLSTATNPHAISQNDLTVGDFSPLQLQLDHGMIVADDRSVPKIPGVRCEVAIPYESIKIDTDGSKTSFTGAQYVELTNYPVRLGKVWITDSHTTSEWGALLVESTNRVVFPYVPIPTGYVLHMYYTKVDACEPPSGTNEVVFSTKSPSEEELIIAGGSGFTALSNTQEAFADAQRFPMLYEMLVDGEGSLIKSPQVIYCYKRLESISTSDTFSISLYGPAHIMCGLADASGSSTMVVKIHLYGKDATGNSLEHVFEFDSSWVNPGPIPKTTLTPEAIKISTDVFYEIDQIIIDERTDDGPSSAIIMWAALNPYDTYDKLKDACHVSQILWDGLQMAEIRDKRIISTTVRDFLLRPTGTDTLKYLANVMAGGNGTIYMEDFRTPKYHNMVPNTQVGTTLADVLPANNISKLRVGAEGFYQTRALPASTASDYYWRVILIPSEEVRAEVYYTYQDPPQIYYWLLGWGSMMMTPVVGLPNTFEATLPIQPAFIKVAVNCVDYIGMVVFG